MSDDITFNIHEAHAHFATEYFNKTREYIGKGSKRSVEDNQTMLHAAIASLFHWSQRTDAKPENLAIGYWQVSRVYNLIQQPNNARTYGLLSLQYAKDLKPLYRAYAYETLARAEMLCNNRVIMLVHLEKARALAAQIEEEEDQQLLLSDLETII